MTIKINKIVAPVVVIAMAILGGFYFYASKPAVNPAPKKERVWTVETTTARVADIQPDLQLFGEVVAGRDVELRSPVSGKVKQVGANFADGGVVQADEKILRIDEFEYQAKVNEISASIKEAHARVNEAVALRDATKLALEQDRKLLRLRERDVRRSKKLLDQGNASDKTVDKALIELARQDQALISRESTLLAHMARVEQQEAILERYRVLLQRAKRDLRNTLLLAPFGGFLFDVSAQKGKHLNTNDRVARLIDAGKLEAKITLSESQYGRLIKEGNSITGLFARARWSVGKTVLEYDAVIDRIAARIDNSSGGMDLYALLYGVDLTSPIRPGAFIELRLKDQMYFSVVRLPETALYGYDTVYKVEAGRLEAIPVEVVGYISGDLLVRGLAGGERIVTTQYAEIGTGQKAEVR